MGEIKHTPGPWQLEGNWQDNGRKLGGWVSTMHPSPVFELNPIVGEKSEIIANAHLIAAAPEMLEALERIVNPAPGVSQKAPAWVYGIARAALSKASPSEGGEA